jgi:hypothetical protein
MVRKSWVSLGMMVLGVCVTAPTFASAEDACRFEIRSRSKVGYRGTAKYFIKGDLVRQEKRSGGGLELIMVSNETGLFIRNKHSNYWFRYPIQANYRMKDRLLGGPIGDVPAFLQKVKAKKTGQEKLDGKPCAIWSYKFARAADKFRLWINEKTGKPVQLERDYIVKGTRKRDILIVEYRDYDSNAKLADDIFRVPSNEKIHDVSSALMDTARETMKNKKDAAPN